MGAPFWLFLSYCVAAARNVSLSNGFNVYLTVETAEKTVDGRESRIYVPPHSDRP
jgi:hypothetical protein